VTRSTSPWKRADAVLVACLAGGCSADERVLPCAENYADADCDGVPDETDRCPGTSTGAPHDPSGCEPSQATACVASPEYPLPDQAIGMDGRDLELRWDGTCDGYVVYLSPDAAFPAATTTVLSRVEGRSAVLSYTRWNQDLSAWDGETLWWQVRGSRDGRETASEPRAVVLSNGTGS